MERWVPPRKLSRYLLAGYSLISRNRGSLVFLVVPSL